MKKFFAILILLAANLSAQTDWTLGGYIQNLQTAWNSKGTTSILMHGTTLNRINFHFYAGENFTFNFGMRNVIDYGGFYSSIPDYAGLISADNGYFDLSKIWTEGKSYSIYSEIDRLNALYTNGNFEMQAGRQRVNLGMNFVWTPNDIFNSASYLNFSYAEKQGSDAVRAQYFFGYASSFEFIYKLDANNEVTAAGVLRLNNWNYDFQFLAGEMRSDYILGFGYAGDISGAGFYGEATYFIDKENFADTSGVLVAAVSGNYTFGNSLFIHGEFLYNSAGATENISWHGSLFSQKYDAKNLSPSRYSLFGEISYPVTPLVKLDLATIFNPLDNSFFLNPNVNFSITDNINLLLLGQFFFGDDYTEWGGFGSFYYAQFQWNF